MTLFELIVILSQVHRKMKGGGYSDGLKFDQFNHRITVGKTVIYDGGVIPQILVVGDDEFEITEGMELVPKVDDKYQEIERLYKAFKNSVPTPYSDCLKCNFLANKLNDIGLMDMMESSTRTKARAELEAFVLLSELEWTNPNHHYWQSSNEKNLIIYKEWSKTK